MQNSSQFRLNSISYSEHEGELQYWRVGEFSLAQVNLLVGRNASGKSRLLKLISVLCKLLVGETKSVPENVNYKICLTHEEDCCEYEFSTHASAVVKEILKINSKVLLNRGENGIGKIWAEQLKTEIQFETPPDQLAAKSRRDAIQHPFFEVLHTWANDLRFYQFGTSLGRDNLLQYNEEDLSGEAANKSEFRNTDMVTRIYIDAYNAYGEEFDTAILRDMSALGYDLDAVGGEITYIRGVKNSVVVMFVREKDLAGQITQTEMSQGMFRALSIVIHLNFCIFKGVPRTILIDDIGEGLDFARSQSFIDLLIQQSIDNNLQIIMTTNDRFVMNGVDLKHWGVVNREGHVVQVINHKNKPEKFEEFEELGLNNFDFFASRFFAD